MEWRSKLDAGELGMNIFEVERNNWWEYMEPIMENVNLSNISMLQNNHLIFTFLNSYDGKVYRYIRCAQILKICIENEPSGNEEFAYFVPDIYKKELSKSEVDSALAYYKYGYNVDMCKLSKQYLLLIMGNDICIDILCGEIEISVTPIM